VPFDKLTAQRDKLTAQRDWLRAQRDWLLRAERLRIGQQLIQSGTTQYAIRERRQSGAFRDRGVRQRSDTTGDDHIAEAPALQRR
jgi:hypothetical protein